MATRLKAAELCAGYGGLALAVEQVFGAETAWVSEYEDAPSRILAHHWPEVPNHGDMTKIDWAAVEPVDVISGGTPCQDLSAAGRRKGMNEGTRSNLWVQMRESIATIKPTYVVWENVRGAYSAGANSEVELCPGCLGKPRDGEHLLRALGRVLGDLSDLGYDCQWRGLRAADVGAPHGRFRVFVLATHRSSQGLQVSRNGGVSRSQAVRSQEGATTLGDPALPSNGDRIRRERPRDSRGRWTRLADDGFPAADSRDAAGHGEWSCAESREGSADASDASSNARRLGHGDDVCLRSGALGLGEDAGRSAAPNDQGAARRTPEPDNQGERLAGAAESRECAGSATYSGSLDCQLWGGHGDVAGASGGGEGEGHQREWDGDAADDSCAPDPRIARAWRERREAAEARIAATVSWGEYEPAIRRWEAALGRRAPAPTEPTGRNGGHRLSARFAEWMMGVPDGWITEGPGITRNEALKAAGNGVVPQQAIAALLDMLAASRTAVGT